MPPTLQSTRVKAGGERDVPRHEPPVFVLTPMYNNEEHLAECIESVIAQSHRNWTYLLVDDGSTDRSVDIARRYAALDDRIHVEINAEHLGVPDTWNRALRLMPEDAEYCKVVHGDDMLFPDCLARMVDLAERDPSIAVVSAYRIDGAHVTLDGIPLETPILSGREVCRRTMRDDLYAFGSPTSLLLRADVIRAKDPFYPPGLNGDTEVCFQILESSDFGFVHQVLTFTRRHEKSLTASVVAPIGMAVPARVKMLQRYGPRYLTKDEFDRRLAALLLGYGRTLVRHFYQFRQPAFRRYHGEALVAILSNVSGRQFARGTILQTAGSLSRFATRTKRALAK